MPLRKYLVKRLCFSSFSHEAIWLAAPADMTVMFDGTKGTLGTIVMPDDLGINEPVWLVPEKQASNITVTDLAGIFPRFL